MERVIVDHFGGPDVLRLVQDVDPQPAQGEVRVTVLAAGVSFTDALLRAGAYLGVPNPPFTPGYEVIGVVDEVGPGCSRLRAGDRVAALTVWGGYAQRVCVPEAEVVTVPDDLDPAQVVSLILTYGTAFQLLHRMARVRSGETVLVHGAAGRVGTAVLELAALAGCRVYGTAAAADRPLVERLGAVAIDYRNQDFLAVTRALPGGGVDVALDGFGGTLSLRSFRALRPGGRLVLFGHYDAMVDGHRNWRGWAQWYACSAAVSLWGLASPRRSFSAYRIQKLHHGRQWIPVSNEKTAPSVGGGPRVPSEFREDLDALVELLRADKIHPVVAERLPLAQAARAHELLAQTASLGKLVLVPEPPAADPARDQRRAL